MIIAARCRFSAWQGGCRGGAEAKNADTAPFIHPASIAPPLFFLSSPSSSNFTLRVHLELPRLQRSSPMDFDLLSGFLDDHQDGSTSPHLLTNLHHRGGLTHEQIAENPALEKRVLDGEDINTNAPDPNQAGAIVNKIEDIFESIVDCILDEGKELVIPLKSRPKKNNANRDDSTQVNKSPNTEARNITFPSKSPQEAWKFSR
jgi:hypothetical protein